MTWFAFRFPILTKPLASTVPRWSFRTTIWGEGQPLLWVAMITSAGNRPWAEDHVVDNLEKAGLPAPSVVRPAKIATIEARHAELLGELTPDAMAEISEVLAGYLGVRP